MDKTRKFYSEDGTPLVYVEVEQEDKRILAAFLDNRLNRVFAFCMDPEPAQTLTPPITRWIVPEAPVFKAEAVVTEALETAKAEEEASLTPEARLRPIGYRNGLPTYVSTDQDNVDTNWMMHRAHSQGGFRPETRLGVLVYELARQEGSPSALAGVLDSQIGTGRSRVPLQDFLRNKRPLGAPLLDALCALYPSYADKLRREAPLGITDAPAPAPKAKTQPHRTAPKGRPGGINYREVSPEIQRMAREFTPLWPGLEHRSEVDIPAMRIARREQQMARMLEKTVPSTPLHRYFADLVVFEGSNALLRDALEAYGFQTSSDTIRNYMYGKYPISEACVEALMKAYPPAAEDILQAYVGDDTPDTPAGDAVDPMVEVQSLFAALMTQNQTGLTVLALQLGRPLDVVAAEAEGRVVLSDETAHSLMTVHPETIPTLQAIYKALGRTWPPKAYEPVYMTKPVAYAVNHAIVKDGGVERIIDSLKGDGIAVTPDYLVKIALGDVDPQFLMVKALGRATGDPTKMLKAYDLGKKGRRTDPQTIRRELGYTL